MKKRNMQSVKLEPDEKALLETVERGEWKSVKKDSRITLRLSTKDLITLKQKAAYKGLPYQTFIASVLHEYAEGHFVETTK
jgi:predicted DNA binding CopG/RHH family protein